MTRTAPCGSALTDLARALRANEITALSALEAVETACRGYFTPKRWACLTILRLREAIWGSINDDPSCCHVCGFRAQKIPCFSDNARRLMEDTLSNSPLWLMASRLNQRAFLAIAQAQLNGRYRVF